jgi:phospholipid-binding lipoprotein MlaA
MIRSIPRSLRLVAVLLLLGAATPAAAHAEGGALDTWNRWMIDFNQWLGEVWDDTKEALPALEASPAVKAAVPNVLSNLINEPVSMISNAIAGDMEGVTTAARRFWTNTTAGWLGVYDVATERGLARTDVDIGLALCARGVPAGPYVVLPFVGPRTVRDAVSDIVLANLILYGAFMPITGPVPPVEFIVAMELLDGIANVAIARQIDAEPVHDRGYEEVRASYLAARERRCQHLIADVAAKSGNGSGAAAKITAAPR